ncbi:MAG: hypothetical protein KDF95_20330, partial [Rhodocyclaceae bacterium]|nr:hypothetical protein [Rhodocyclaceae bacterium]
MNDCLNIWGLLRLSPLDSPATTADDMGRTIRRRAFGFLSMRCGTVNGAGRDELRWPRAVRTGDVLSPKTDVLKMRPSKFRPARDITKAYPSTHDQDDQLLLSRKLV